MPLVPCDPCGCIPGNEGLTTYRQNVRQTLCAILAAIGGGGGGGITEIAASSGGSATGPTVTLVGAGTVTTSRAGNTITITGAGGGGGGIVRSVSSVAVDTPVSGVAGVDYVYLVSGTTTMTMPTPVGNTNQYTIKRVGVGIVTIAPDAAETFDGSASMSLTTQYTSVDLISDGTNWNVV